MTANHISQALHYKLFQIFAMDDLLWTQSVKMDTKALRCAQPAGPIEPKGITLWINCRTEVSYDTWSPDRSSRVVANEKKKDH